eukprot:TCONS_00046511-protein
MMEKKLRKELEEQEQQEAVQQVEESFDIIDGIDVESLSNEPIETEDLHPRLTQLKIDLAEKKDLLWQLETQIIDFLGNKGDFIKKEFKTRTTQDYYLVPTRMETYIPSGTEVTIFGQLPNRRWRCLIEMDELIAKMNSLVEDLDNQTQKRNTLNLSTPPNDNTKFIVSRTKSSLEQRRNNTPSYPLIGSLPTSILEHTPVEETQGTDDPFVDEEPSVNVQSPYSSHKRENRRTPLKPIFDDDIKIIDLELEDMDDQVQTRSRDSSSITEESNFEDVATMGDAEDEEESDNESLYDNVAPEENESGVVERRNFLRGNSGDGIVIRKKLRQKGISIIVGSSSSEGEGDDLADIEDNLNNDNNNNSSNDSVYRKLHSSTSSSKEGEVWGRQDSSTFMRFRKRKDTKQSKRYHEFNLWDFSVS